MTKRTVIAFCIGAAFVYTLGFISGSLIFMDFNSGSNSLPSKEPLVTIRYKLAILVFSSPGNFQLRDVIRKTWLNSYFSDVVYYFVVGDGKLAAKIKNVLETEASKHSDLLILNLTDAYANLTTKLLHSFVWLSENIQADYILKCDDDTYVRVDKLRLELLNRLPGGLYWGFFDGRAHVKKIGDWQEHNWFLCDRYLPYALGGGYIVSKDIVDFISKNHVNLTSYKSEDVSLGVWTAALNIKRLHDPRFNTESKSRGCSNRFLISHKLSEADIQGMHNTLAKEGHLCEFEYQARPSYKYNWSVPPSKCCIRNNSSII